MRCSREPRDNGLSPPCHWLPVLKILNAHEGPSDASEDEWNLWRIWAIAVRMNHCLDGVQDPGLRPELCIFCDYGGVSCRFLLLVFISMSNTSANEEGSLLVPFQSLVQHSRACVVESRASWEGRASPFSSCMPRRLTADGDGATHMPLSP